MTEKSLQQVVHGIVFGGGGKNHYVQELSGPFFDQLSRDLRDAGYEKALSEPVWKDELKQRARPTAVFDPVSFSIIVGCFVGSAIGSWAIGKVCDELWGKFNGSFKTLKTNYKKRAAENKRLVPDEIKFNVDFHFRNDEISVVVEGTAQNESEIDSFESLLPKAVRQALAWIKDKGITSKVIRYNIKNGELSEFPTLSDT